jgi:hypothetical protein
MTVRDVLRAAIAHLRAVDDGPGPPAAGTGVPFSTAQLRAIRTERASRR